LVEAAWSHLIEKIYSNVTIFEYIVKNSVVFNRPNDCIV
jgi:hypothetical protein